MRKYILWASNALPVAIGVVAAAYTELSTWVDMKEGLIAFLGFLAASLVQVMPITANFLQSDELSPKEADDLTTALGKQQLYWVGLLGFTIFTLIVLIACTVLVGKVSNVVLVEVSDYSIKLSPFITFLLVCSLFFVLLKMVGLFEGVLSLHKLRAKMVIDLAKRRHLEKNHSSLGAKHRKTNHVPSDYGEIILPPKDF